MTPTSPTTPIRILAVANSDSNVKWAAATLDAAAGTSTDDRIEVSLVVIQGHATPTPSQIDVALRGSGLRTAPVVSPRLLVRTVRDLDPDILLVAATGPAAENVARLVVRATRRTGRRPALVGGFPGIGLPATARGTAWRRWCDAFIVHSPREAQTYVTSFRAGGVSPRIVLARLPFLRPRLPEVLPARRAVFATQAKVPNHPDDRRRILRGLSDLADAGFDVVVKDRTVAGELQTHHEAHPYATLWARDHEALHRPVTHLRFETGPMSEWLTPDAVLVTVSSTAALESMALGLQTAFIGDFGVTRALMNGAYADSGCMVPLADLACRFREGSLHPDPGWLAETYLFTEPSELPEAVRELADSRRAGTLTPLRSVRPYRKVDHFYAATTTWQPRLVPLFAWLTRRLRTLERMVSRWNTSRRIRTRRLR